MRKKLGELTVTKISGSASYNGATTTVSLNVGTGLTLYKDLFPVVEQIYADGAIGTTHGFSYSYNGSTLHISMNRYVAQTMRASAYVLRQ